MYFSTFLHFILSYFVENDIIKRTSGTSTIGKPKKKAGGRAVRLSSCSWMKSSISSLVKKGMDEIERERDKSKEWALKAVRKRKCL